MYMYHLLTTSFILFPKLWYIDVALNIPYDILTLPKFRYSLCYSKITIFPTYEHTTFSMDQDTAEAILSHHDGLRSWPQPFTVAIGETARTPDNVGDSQPSEYPSWPYHQPVYRFDPRYYSGEVAQQSLMSDIRKSLVGVIFLPITSMTGTCTLPFVSSVPFPKYLVRTLSIGTSVSWK